MRGFTKKIHFIALHGTMNVCGRNLGSGVSTHTKIQLRIMWQKLFQVL